MRKILLAISTLFIISNLSAQEIKNIIFLIGDGMGLASASMIQVENNYDPTIFDSADNIALQKQNEILIPQFPLHHANLPVRPILA